MPPYLYALIGGLVFAIAHGMRFTVSPVPVGIDRDLVQITNTRVAATEHDTAWTHNHIRIAEIGY